MRINTTSDIQPALPLGAVGTVNGVGAPLDPLPPQPTPENHWVAGLLHFASLGSRVGLLIFSNSRVGQQPQKCDSNSTVGQQPLKCDDAHSQEILECCSTLQNSSHGRTENNELYSSSMIFEWVKITKQFSPHPPQMGQTEVVSGLARLSPHAAHVC